MKLVLASASPRRKKLLRRIVKRFSVSAANMGEKIGKGEPYRHAAMRLAEKKARLASSKNHAAIVIGADTIAYFRKRNFRKTENEATARRALSFLRGKTHFVITGVAVIFPSGKCVKYAVKAAVEMKKFDEKTLGAYLEGGEWRGRAGSYDISGKGAALVEKVRGEKETVIGLPLKKLRALLKK